MRWRARGRTLVPAAVLVVLVAACAPAHAATHDAPHAVTLHGRLLRVHDGTLTVQERGQPGLRQVTFTPAATPIYAVTRTTAAAIEPGSCVAASGERDARGEVTARAIVVAGSVDDACPSGSVPDPPPSPSPPSPSESPVRSTSPGPVVIRGQVLSVGGGALALGGAHGSPAGSPAVLAFPRDVQVLFFAPSNPTALVTPSCVVIEGTQTGHAIRSRRIVDWPPDTQC